MAFCGHYGINEAHLSSSRAIWWSAFCSNFGFIAMGRMFLQANEMCTGVIKGVNWTNLMWSPRSKSGWRDFSLFNSSLYFVINWAWGVAVQKTIFLWWLQYAWDCPCGELHGLVFSLHYTSLLLDLVSWWLLHFSVLMLFYFLVSPSTPPPAFFNFCFCLSLFCSPCLSVISFGAFFLWNRHSWEAMPMHGVH